MTNEKMTVHKALAELKIIDDRINNAIVSGTYVIANKHSNTKIHGMTIDDFLLADKNHKQFHDHAHQHTGAYFY